MSRAQPRKGVGWVYDGVWLVLVRLLRVPELPPELPGVLQIAAIRPADGYLSYQKLIFWLTAWCMPLAATVAIVAVAIPLPIVAAIIGVPVIVFFTAPVVMAYVALHVKFDSTWYVLSDRSIRLRRGIMTIHETTITYENIQNVTIEQGPIQRVFGICDLRIDTAGGGGGQHQAHGAASMHVGLLQGIDTPEQLRELIMARARASRSAGLGDDADHRGAASIAAGNEPGWTLQHVEELRSIRDGLRALNAG